MARGGHRAEPDHAQRLVRPLGEPRPHGIEDNLRLDRDTLAPSSAALVRRVVDPCDRCARSVATPAEARATLKLPQVARA